MAGLENTPDDGKIKEDRKGPPARKIPKKITEKYLYNSGLAYLQKFTSSVPNFRTVMTRKIRKSCAAHPDQDFAECLKHLETVTQTFLRQGYLNDEAYAKGLIYSARNRGLSRNALIAKLRQKGLDADSILALDNEDERNPESIELIAALKTMRRKKLGLYATVERERLKDLAALARAGFSSNVAHKALTMTAQDIDDALAGVPL